jgi:hypothetical protein
MTKNFDVSVTIPYSRFREFSRLEDENARLRAKIIFLEYSLEDTQRSIDALNCYKSAVEENRILVKINEKHTNFRYFVYDYDNIFARWQSARASEDNYKSKLDKIPKIVKWLFNVR